MKSSLKICKKNDRSREVRNVLVAAYKMRKTEEKEAIAAANAEEKAAAKAEAAERKKRKREKGYANKSEKKPRISEERIKAVSEKMIAELAKNYAMGIKEMTLDVLTIQVGQKNKRNDSIFESVKLLKRNGIADKFRGDICKLTEKGVKEYVKEAEVPDSPDGLLEMYKKQFLTKLESQKNGSGSKVQNAADKLWNLLKDGKSHKMDAVLKLTEYGMERSTGIAEILKVLTKELKFAVKEKKTIQFTDKVFGPFGRP